MISKDNNHRFHRQIGLVDQSRMENVKIQLSGLDSVIIPIIAQIYSMGAAMGKEGHIAIDKDPSNIQDNKTHNWTLGLPEEEMNWGVIVNHLEEKGLKIELGNEPEYFHIHCSNCIDDIPDGIDLVASHWPGNVLLSKKQLIFKEKPEMRQTFIDASLQVALAAAATQNMLLQLGLLREDVALDRWVTYTVQVDNLPEEALQKFSDSAWGTPIISPLENRSGSLLRFRIPLEQTPPNIMNTLSHSCLKPTIFEYNWIQNVGPLDTQIGDDGEILPSTSCLPNKLSQAKIMILGAGGLGSWAAPLIASGVENEGLELTIVDSDNSVDLHNLNRQVLYTEENLGYAKAPVAASKIRALFPKAKSIIGIKGKLEERHVSRKCGPKKVLGTTLAEVFDRDCIIDDNNLIDALNDMDVAVACLDNQYARTLLNRKCVEAEVSMVNGGGEGFNGIVELLENNVCMVCRYGKDRAFTKEIISCQEAGSRPVASIVTTTSWVGAMQASIALLDLYSKYNPDQEIAFRFGLEWDMGVVTERPIVRLPWFSEQQCNRHLLQEIAV